MTLKLTDEALREFRDKLERSVVAKRNYPYIFALEKRNYRVFDRLVMIMLNFGQVAFVYALSAVKDMDQDYVEPDEDYEVAL